MTMRNAFEDLATEVSNSDIAFLMRRVLNHLLSPLGFDKALRRYRQTAIIESGTVTTCSTVGNISQIGGRDAGTMLINPTSRTSWALNVRARIT